MHVVLLLTLSLFPLVPGGDEIVEQKIIEIARQDNQVMGHLDYLVNRIGPRLTGSANDHRACEWARDTFIEMGLENVTMEKCGEFAVAFNRGPWSGRMVEPEVLEFEFGTPAWSAGTKGAVKAEAIRPPEDIELANSADYAGKWILMERAQRRGNREVREQQQAQREYLEQAGIAGWIYPTRDDKYIVTGGSPRISWDELPQIPRINLRKDQWEAVAKRVDAGEKVVLQFDIRNYFVKGPVPYYTVYGDIVGSEFPDEYVIVGAHIDSWDGATGTSDDGMGCAVAIEAARLLKKAGATPRRTVRFMLWSGEEQGLLASRGWVDAHPELHEKISGVFVHDGGPNPISGVMATPQMMDDFELAFASVMQLDPEIPFEIREVQGLPNSPGSDHLSFLGKNIPGFFWDQKGKANWRHGIHTQFDTYDLAIPEYMEHSALAAALGSLGVANLDDLLSRENLRARRGPGGGGRRMGVFLDEVTIQGVTPDSVAAKAGVKEGDVILKVDGQPVADRAALVRAIRAGEARKKVLIKRGEQELEVIMEWPEEKKEEKEEEKPKKRVVL